MKEMIENLIFFNFNIEAKEIQIQFEKIINLILKSKNILELEFTPPAIEGEKDPIKIIPEKIEIILGNVNWKSII